MTDVLCSFNSLQLWSILQTIGLLVPIPRLAFRLWPRLYEPTLPHHFAFCNITRAAILCYTPYYHPTLHNNAQVTFGSLAASFWNIPEYICFSRSCSCFFFWFVTVIWFLAALFSGSISKTALKSSIAKSKFWRLRFACNNYLKRTSNTIVLNH